MGETNSDDSDKPRSYGPSLDMSIALRKGTRSCTKHSMCNYMFYINLLPKFMTFTASLDTAIVPKKIHKVIKSFEWKKAVMEEMGVLEKNKT